MRDLRPWLLTGALWLMAAVPAQAQNYPGNQPMFSPSRADIGLLGGYLFNYEADGSTVDTPSFRKEAVIALEATYDMTPQLQLVVLPSYGADTKVSRTQVFLRMKLWKPPAVGK